jgi:hypothetical protein
MFSELERFVGILARRFDLCPGMTVEGAQGSTTPDWRVCEHD